MGLFLLSAVHLSAQNNTWFATGNTWIYSYQMAFETGTYQAQYEVIEQTNFAGRDCAKVDYVGDGVNPFSCLAVQPPYYFYTSGDSVFYASENDGVFHLVYDMGAELGDTWDFVIPVREFDMPEVFIDTFVAEVTGVSNVQVDGQTVRSLTLQYTYAQEGDPHTELEGGNEYIITEYIGSETGFLVPFGNFMVESVCEGQESESLSYLNPDFESCALGLNQLENNDELIVYPNPASDKIVLSLGKFEGGTLDIFNALGKRISTQRVGTSPMEIDVSEYSAGTYLMYLRKESATATAKFVVVQLKSPQ